MASATLNTLHNLRFYLDTMHRIREAIVFGTLEEVRQEYLRIFPLQPADVMTAGDR
jgi:tRNA-guanine family transglycosylase